MVRVPYWAGVVVVGLFIANNHFPLLDDQFTLAARWVMGMP